MFGTEEYVDLGHMEHRQLFDNIEHIWEVLPKISEYIRCCLSPGNHGETVGAPFIGHDVFIGKGTIIEHGAMVKGPAWIGQGCKIRNGCYIRENVVVGNNVVLGNSCEFKNCVIFDDAEIPHFSYVGDSILGHRSHLGAGVILSNVKLDGSVITLKGPNGQITTGLRKFGAVIGDHVEIGCNSVLSPGSIIGRNSVLYPLSQWRGVLAENQIVKHKQSQDIVGLK